MSTDIDWTIEHETLPADEPSPLEPEPLPPPPRRPARWLWLALVLITAAVGILLYLWSLGGRTEPLPNPDTAQESLDAAIQLEIKALQTRDQEIFAQVQDEPSHRSNLQPAPDGWFAWDGELAGAVELVDLQLLTEDSALAEVQLIWNKIPYRLFWFYSRENQRWVHTDWLKMDLGPEETLVSNEVQVSYHQVFYEQAEILAKRVDDYLEALCGTLTCPDRPITVSLKLAPSYLRYHADQIEEVEMADDQPLILSYRLPAPLRIRWPWDHESEPLVLGSLGRALAFELLVQDHLDGIPPENEAALTLSIFWLAHHLLDLESPPTTQWLDEAIARDGLPTFFSFVSALKEGDHPTEALDAAFQPETVEVVRSLPDFFGWRAEVLDPEHQAESQLRLLELPRPGYSTSYLPPDWTRELQVRFDWEVDPWAPDGRPYKRAVPNIIDVVYQGDLATASGPVDAEWAAAFFFRQVDDDWRPVDFDEISLAQQVAGIDDYTNITDGPIMVSYWPWDEPYITETVQVLRFAVDTVKRDFHMGEDQHFTFSIIPFYDTDGTMFELEPDVFRILSRTSPQWLGKDDDQVYQTSLVSNAVYQMLSRNHPGPSGQGYFLLSGLVTWQADQVISKLGYESVLSIWLPFWKPPADPAEEGWVALENLWAGWNHDLAHSGGVDLDLTAAMVTDYIVDQYGPEKLSLMLDTLESASSMDEWVLSVTGRPLDEFEVDWREWVIENWSGD